MKRTRVYEYRAESVKPYVAVFRDGGVKVKEHVPYAEAWAKYGNAEWPEPVWRPLHVIAREIIGDWKAPYFGAVPYIDAMRHLASMDSSYGMDSAADIVRYFVYSNAGTWRGETARLVKAELRAMLAKHDKSR